MRSSLISLRVASVLLIFAAASLCAGDGTTDLRLNPEATTTISTPGSYTLVGSVTMVTEVSAIIVAANDVTIDLNGHTIASVGGGLTGDGIGANFVIGLRVHSGTVSGFVGVGINCSSTASIHDVRVVGCAIGITVGDSSVVRDCVVTGCSGHGIIAGDRSLVEGCDASGNNTLGDAAGIYVGNRSSVRNCVASANTAGSADTSATGILTGNGCTLDGNACNENNGNGTGSGIGMQTGDKCAILHNTVADNTGGAADGSGIGIKAGDYCTVSLNTVTNNDGGGNGEGTGIQGGNNCRVTNNTANDNDAGASGTEAYGIKVSANCTVSGNTCNSNQEGASVVGFSRGILAGSYSLVENNTCGNNDAIADGGAVGINTGQGCTLRNNDCSFNYGAGNGSGRGIWTSRYCHVEGNTCVSNQNGLTSFGLWIDGHGTTVIRNVTGNNGSGGISWSVAGYTGRCEQNRMGGGDGVINLPPTSVGAGDLANVDF